MPFPHRPPSALLPGGGTFFVVTNLNDGGPGSLKQAVIDANVEGLKATILFQTGLTGTIVQPIAQIAITESMAIRGPGSSVIALQGSYSGVGPSGARCLYLGNFPDHRLIGVFISGLTLKNGGGQGGGNLICWGADLVAENLVIENGTAWDPAANGGGGVYLYGGPNEAEITMRNCVISGNNSKKNGGGIAIGGGVHPITVALESCEVSGNSCDINGGGVSMLYDGTLSIADSTISGNTSVGNGAGVYGGSGATARTMELERCAITGNNAGNGVTTGIGGGVSVNKGTCTVADTTASGNTAATGAGMQFYETSLDAKNITVANNAAAFGGGIEIDSPPSANIEFATVSGNTATTGGGGLRLYNGTVEFSNSITGANAAPTDADVQTLPGGTLDANYSLIKDPGAANITGANNITGQDPQLGALANNGGPTETMLPAPTSPVIDAGDPAFTPPPATDQRGLPRVVGGRVDMGSVEVQ